MGMLIWNVDKVVFTKAEPSQMADRFCRNPKYDWFERIINSIYRLTKDCFSHTKESSKPWVAQVRYRKTMWFPDRKSLKGCLSWVKMLAPGWGFPLLLLLAQERLFCASRGKRVRAEPPVQLLLLSPGADTGQSTPLWINLQNPQIA